MSFWWGFIAYSLVDFLCQQIKSITDISENLLSYASVSVCLFCLLFLKQRKISLNVTRFKFFLHKSCFANLCMVSTKRSFFFSFPLYNRFYKLRNTDVPPIPNSGTETLCLCFHKYWRTYISGIHPFLRL